MLHFPRWKVLAVLAVVLAGVVFALPNVLPRPWQETVAAYTGLRPMTRGLDLQGGTSLLMEIDGREFTGNLIGRQMDDIRTALRTARIGYKLNRTADGVTVAITDAADTDKAFEAVRGLTQPIESDPFLGDGAGKHLFIIARSGRQIDFNFDETGLKARISAATEQALRVLGSRLDGFGIIEVSIQRQGLDRILIQIPGAGLPDEAKRALGLIGPLATREDRNNLAIALRSGFLPARLVYIDAANESAGGGQAKRAEL